MSFIPVLFYEIDLIWARVDSVSLNVTGWANMEYFIAMTFEMLDNVFS